MNGTSLSVHGKETGMAIDHVMVGGSGGAHFDVSTNQKHWLGQRMVYGDGRLGHEALQQVAVLRVGPERLVAIHHQVSNEFIFEFKTRMIATDVNAHAQFNHGKPMGKGKPAKHWRSTWRVFLPIEGVTYWKFLI